MITQVFIAIFWKFFPILPVLRANQKANSRNMQLTKNFTIGNEFKSCVSDVKSVMLLMPLSLLFLCLTQVSAQKRRKIFCISWNRVYPGTKQLLFLLRMVLHLITLASLRRCLSVVSGMQKHYFREKVIIQNRDFSLSGLSPEILTILLPILIFFVWKTASTVSSAPVLLFCFFFKKGRIPVIHIIKRRHKYIKYYILLQN